MRSSVKVASILATLLLAAVGSIAPGCSNQGEGEVCNLLAGNSGNDDCSSGFECSSILNTTAAQDKNIGRCCLPLVARSQSTVAICQSQQSTGGADAAVPVDTDAATTADTGASTTPDAATTSDGATATPDAGDGG